MYTESFIATDFPVSFGGILIKSLRFFKHSFIQYLFLSAVSYLPFVLFEVLMSSYTIDIIEFFHGNFLDIIVFLTLPTLFMQKRVFSAATIQLFVQRFFASAVAISFIQLGTLLLFTLVFSQISPGVILVGMIPYIYLIFAGFFLIMENSPQLFSVRANLVNSIRLVKTRFLIIFIQYLIITLIIVLPFLFFSMWYMTGQPEFAAFEEVYLNEPANNALISQKLIDLVNSFNQPGFKWSRIGIHILFRPVKALFLSFLFLGLLFQVNPQGVKNYLGFGKPETPAADFERSE
jgi:hypothetical protein